MTELTEFKRWENNISGLRLPKWKEMPGLGLYVDQVAAVINEQLTTLGVEPITKSMINNYVKKKIIQAPIKKKYAANQIVDLLIIGLFKNTFTIDNIRQGISQITITMYPQQAYDRFVEIFNARLAKKEVIIENDSDRLMDLAIAAVLAELKTTYLLKELNKVNPPKAEI